MEILEIPCIDGEFSTTMSVHVVTLLTIYLNKTKPNKTASVSCYKEVSGTYAKGFYKSLRETKRKHIVIFLYSQDRAKSRQR